MGVDIFDAEDSNPPTPKDKDNFATGSGGMTCRILEPRFTEQNSLGFNQFYASPAVTWSQQPMTSYPYFYSAAATPSQVPYSVSLAHRQEPVQFVSEQTRPGIFRRRRLGRRPGRPLCRRPAPEVRATRMFPVSTTTTTSAGSWWVPAAALSGLGSPSATSRSWSSRRSSTSTSKPPRFVTKLLSLV